MALISFKVLPIKAISHAECTSVPRVMVIAGPNGSGKSTLLYEIYQKRGVTTDIETKILYQPPHRAIRRTTIRRSWLGGIRKSIFDLFSGTDVSGYEGLSFSNSTRTPDNVDEAGSTIKHTLGKIENRRQAILSEWVDKCKKNNQSVDTASIPDIYYPLKELTKYLLPHLVFDRVDFKNEDDIKCVWKRKDKQSENDLDIDDLSSGEKSIIILFLPLLESDINHFLEETENLGREVKLTSDITLPDRAFIIDEPELHLHPDLQAKILTYIRGLSTKSNIQFILATHSPTILDQALDEELYLLSPRSDDVNENQLKKIASNIERLEALKQLAGNTYLVTTGRSIICIEGDKNSTTEPTDIRLLEILYPRSTAFTFVPTGGKGNVIKLVQQLREHLPEESFKIRINGLVDKDQSKNSLTGVFLLPVCMIENLLLNEEAIFEYFQSLGIVELSNVQTLKEKLKEIADGLKDEEIACRIMRKLKSYTVRISGITKDDLKNKLETEIAEIKKLLPEDNQIDTLISEVNTEVNKIISDGDTLKYFRGKIILKKLYSDFIQSKNIFYSRFCYELAEIVAKKTTVGELLNPVFDQIENIPFKE